jgi:hypothetical protein
VAGPDVSSLSVACRRRAGSVLVAIALAGCGPDRSVPASEPGAEAPPDVTASLSEIVASSALVGHRVRLIGRCLTQQSSFELDRPAGVVIVWQFAADGVTVLVAGPPPPGCASRHAPVTVMITALVAEDTLPAIGDLPTAPRRYLVRAEPERR